MKIRSEFLVPTKSYADHTPEATPEVLDCSLGVNPYGFPASARRALESFSWDRLADYPHTHRAEDAICRYWQAFAPLERQNILLTDGSIAALYLINCLFSKPGAEVVGFVPSFTDMLVNARMLGMRYTPVALDETGSAEPLLAAITADTALVYVDNPNNPTGQTMPLVELERIVARARALDVYVLVDEAYGDFIPPEESILSRWGYDKLLVTRTFSKGFGLAGLRAGYIVADPTVIGYLSKISNPYMMNELTREVVAAALEEPTHPMAHCGEFARVKETIRRQIGKNLTLLHTDDRVPICTLCHRNPEANLQRLLYANGILTVSGIDFDGLACNCVRLRVPREEAAQRLVDAIRQVEAH